MARRSNKSAAKILSQTNVSPVDRNDNDKHLALLEMKITLATEGFTTDRFCELVLRDRKRLSDENALIICEYIIAMKREINPRLSYKRSIIQILSELSKAVGIQKKFIDMTRDNILYYLDKYRKPENEDPLHEWMDRHLQYKTCNIMSIF